MKIVFFGTPEFSKEFLSALLADGNFSVVAVVCQPDAQVGRKKILTPPPTKVLASEHGIPVYQPAKLKDEQFFSDLQKLQADAFVVVAYGRIIPDGILNIVRLGTVNVHPSLLPKYRGPSPIQSAIVAGESETGISIMLLDTQMDHGPILAQQKISLDDRETPESLRAKVIKIGTPLLLKALKELSTGASHPIEQNHEQATFCKLLTKEDGQINWTQTAEQIDSQIRGLTPWPGTWTTWPNHGQLKITEASISDQQLPAGQVKIIDRQLLIGTGTLALIVTKLQLEGAKELTAREFILGHQDLNGTNF